MRTLLIASAGLAIMAASGTASAQNVKPSGAPMGPNMGMHMAPNMGPNRGMRMPMVQHPGVPQVNIGGDRWGSKVGGHWWGGVNAPGGWKAYRRPARGYVLPRYWVSPRFYVTDWSNYGLVQPGAGYNWVRYYDDAVLVDGRGSVYDVANDVDWDRYDDGYYTDDTQVYADNGDGYAPGYGQRGYDQAGSARPAKRHRGDRDGAPAPGYATAPDYAPALNYAPGYDERVYRERRRGSDGLAGAAVGGVVGGVAGNVIAGRGNHLGGTLIGAGVGAVAGYAVDRAASDHRGDRYAPPSPPARGYAPYPSQRYPERPYPPRPYPAQPYPVVTTNGGTTVTTTSTGGYASRGYYYPAGSTTTVVVQSQPVVTTTTTETVTYSNVRHRRAATKIVKRWRPKPVCSCR